MASTIDLCVADLVHERIRHADRLTPDLAHRVAASLLPLSRPDSGEVPAIDFEFVDRMPVPSIRAEFGVRLAPDGGVWIGDRFARGALVTVRDGKFSVQLDRSADANLLELVRTPLLEHALYDVGGGTLRAACVEVDGRRVAIGGWSGNGKTRVVLELLLEHGGRLLGDDLVAVTPLGDVAPLWCGLTLRPDHDLQLAKSPGRGSRLSRAAARWLDQYENHPNGRRTPRAVVGVGARGMRHFMERRVGFQEIAVDHRLGSQGRIDALLVLGPATGAKDPIRLLAAFGCSYSAHLAAFEAGFRYQGLQEPLLPDFDRRLQVAKKALAETKVLYGKADDLSQARAVVGELLDAVSTDAGRGLRR
ncbi:MAG: hypothetical protein WD532_00245 [Acidimicrobiia bacterium]